jgi:hypothetical protein
MEMLFLIVVNLFSLRLSRLLSLFVYLSANNVSIVVCSSLLTSSNMSKNFLSPSRIAAVLFCQAFCNKPG